VTITLQQNLTSALFKLDAQFHSDPQSLHFAVAIVFSSILRKYGYPCIIVGGQSASYWMRLPGSIDTDFVSSQIDQIALVLEQCGFQRSDKFTFRYNHPKTNVLIELVGEEIKIGDLKGCSTVEIGPDDIRDPLVRSLMPGPAEILDPLLVFLNYIEAADKDSIWFNYKDEGAIAIERAQAMLALYEEYIKRGLNRLVKSGEISLRIQGILSDKFNLKL